MSADLWYTNAFHAPMPHDATVVLAGPAAQSAANPLCDAGRTVSGHCGRSLTRRRHLPSMAVVRIPCRRTAREGCRGDPVRGQPEIP